MTCFACVLCWSYSKKAVKKSLHRNEMKRSKLSNLPFQALILALHPVGSHQGVALQGVDLDMLHLE